MADTTHKTKIVVEGDASKAVSAFGAVRSAVQGVSRVVSVFTRSLAIFGLAANAVQLIIEGYKKLSSWIERTAGASREAHEKRMADRHAAAIASLTDRYKRLNDEIKRTADLEASINGIIDNRKSKERDIEDARLERDKQLEISKLDPTSANYDANKRAIENRYADKAGDIAAARAAEDAYEKSSRLNGQANDKDAEVAKLNKLLTSARGELAIAQGGEDDKQIAEAKKKVDEILAAIAKATSDAAILRQQAEDAYNGGDAASMRNNAEKQKRDNDAARESSKAAAEETAKREAAAQKENEWAAKQRREEEAANIESKQKRIAAIEDYNARLIGAVGPSSNRLTAMGLGAGVSAPTVGLSGDVHKMLDLMKQQLDEQRKQNNARSEIASLFSD